MTRAPLSAAVLAFLLATVMAASTQAYDMNKTPEGGFVFHWARDTVAMRISPTMYAAFPEADVRAAVDGAAAAWAGLEGVPTITVSDWPANPYVPGDSRGNGIYWVEASAWTWNPSELAETNVSFTKATGAMTQADVCLNSGHPWSLDGANDTYDLQAVLTHEFGHVLGLGESELEAATMFARGMRGDTSKRTLDRDDERGVERLYATAAEYDFSHFEAMGCQATHTGESGVPGAVLFLLALIVFAYWFRSRNP